MELKTTLKSNSENWLINLSSWWNKLVAVIALVNLILVLFNLSYIPLRNIYLRHFPAIVNLYDPVKSIQRHPETSHYLNTVDLLTAEINKKGIQAPSIEPLLASLREQSTELIEENPFLVGNKFGTFAKLTRRMRNYVNTDTAKSAFDKFWSQEYLNKIGSDAALSFFNQNIRFLLSTSYLRDVDEDGQIVDEFWRIDLFFIIFFAFDFIARTFFISRKNKDLTWFDAMLRRWYNTLLLLPTWRVLRVIPVSVRLHRSGLINLERILAEITHEPAAYLADRVSNFLMVRLINQSKNAVEEGKLAQALLSENQPYIKVSEINKFDAITERLLEISIYKVLPQLEPNLQALLHHSLKGAIANSEFYLRLAKIPGIESLPKEVIEQLANYLAQSVLEVLISSYADLEGKKLLDQLTEDFQKSLRSELQNQAVQEELQLLVSELLEELKLNYVQSSQEHDPDATLTEAEKLRWELEN